MQVEVFYLDRFSLIGEFGFIAQHYNLGPLADRFGIKAHIKRYGLDKAKPHLFEEMTDDKKAE